MHFTKLVVALFLIAWAPAAFPSRELHSPVVSPDETKVAVCLVGTPPVCCVADLANGHVTKLRPPSEIYLFISWFPKGDALVATLLGSGPASSDYFSIWKLNVADGSSEMLVKLKDDICDWYPLVSPDSKTILFRADKRKDLALADLLTHEVRYLTSSGDVKRWAYTWDNRGKTVYFTTGPTEGQGSIWAINVDGTNKKLMANVVLPTRYLSVSADGSWLAYASRHEDDAFSSLFVTSVRDGATIRISEKARSDIINWGRHRNSLTFATPEQEVMVYSAGQPIGEGNPRRLDLKARYALWAKNDTALIVPEGDNEGLRLYDLESKQSKRILSKDDIEK